MMFAIEPRMVRLPARVLLIARSNQEVSGSGMEATTGFRRSTMVLHYSIRADISTGTPDVQKSFSVNFVETMAPVKKCHSAVISCSS
jgi:hypothetical protein